MFPWDAEASAEGVEEVTGNIGEVEAAAWFMIAVIFLRQGVVRLVHLGVRMSSSEMSGTLTSPRIVVLNVARTKELLNERHEKEKLSDTRGSSCLPRAIRNDLAIRRLVRLLRINPRLLRCLHLAPGCLRLSTPAVA